MFQLSGIHCKPLSPKPSPTDLLVALPGGSTRVAAGGEVPGRGKSKYGCTPAAEHSKHFTPNSKTQPKTLRPKPSTLPLSPKPISLNPRPKTDSTSAEALGPTCSHLGARCLSREANADSGVCVVRVGVLARLAFAIITEAPASFVAIFALDVEARPDGDRLRVYNRSTRSNGNKVSKQE